MITNIRKIVMLIVLVIMFIWNPVPVSVRIWNLGIQHPLDHFHYQSNRLPNDLPER